MLRPMPSVPGNDNASGDAVQSSTSQTPRALEPGSNSSSNLVQTTASGRNPKLITIYTSTENSSKTLKHQARVSLIIAPAGNYCEPIVWKVLDISRRSEFRVLLSWCYTPAVAVPVQDTSFDIQTIHPGQCGIYRREGVHPAWSPDYVPICENNKIAARNEDDIPHRFILGSVDEEHGFQKFADLGRMKYAIAALSNS
ncbi:hypothetical protein NLI96_g8948 [Meripilus lineatus]|uniref:Uncharacterized protein n=1 Tax=Meripilus lineatus TaxID=2056292 RepID=A0AAD5UYN9_9APHY|nr:hypothetical protein NLI96_g8948 [Physisporinus lineatus]